MTPDISIRYSNTRTDSFRSSASATFRNAFLLTVVIIGSGLVGMTQWKALIKESPWPIVAITVTLVSTIWSVAWLLLAAVINGLVAACSKNPGFFTEHAMTLNVDGVVEETHLGTQFVRWDGIVKLRKSRWFIQIFIASNLAHFVPRRAFTDQDSFDRFCETCRDRVAAARTAAS